MVQRSGNQPGTWGPGVVGLASTTKTQEARLSFNALRERRSFAKLPEVLPPPNLISVQKESFDWFVQEGLAETLKEISPVEDFTGNLALQFLTHEFKEPKFDEDECKEKDMTFSRPLFVTAAFINKETGEIKEQTVFMGDFPMMTNKGTFIINGTERVVVSQLVRSPGVYFDRSIDKTSDKDIFACKIIPARGAWLEFETDKRDTVGVRIDRKRRQNVTVLLKALGYGRECPEPPRKPVLQFQALRPRTRRSLQGQQEARLQVRREGDQRDGDGASQGGHPRDDPVPRSPPRRGR